jgi:hypothetical protein
MARKVMLFAGAPAPSCVDASSCTIHDFEATFKQFMGIQQVSSSPDNPKHDASSSTLHAPWRSLPLAKLPLHTGFSQDHHYLSQNTTHADFFTTTDASTRVGNVTRSFEEAEDVMTQFCEQSLAAHDPMPSDKTTEEDTSFLTTTTTSFSKTSSTAAAPQPIPCHLSDLEDIPPARNVLDLIPQTITVNIIAGIISLAQPRTVTTRWGRTLSLIEVLVGDETKSGFGVTFWLSSGSLPESQLSTLRRQDVVLLRNVALHVFRGKVYGQSLRGGMTQISLLWRRDGGGQYSTRSLAGGGSSTHPQMEKTKRVKDWVLDFVGADRPSRTRTTRATRRTPRKSWDQPPDDTQ